MWSSILPSIMCHLELSGAPHFCLLIYTCDFLLFWVQALGSVKWLKTISCSWGWINQTLIHWFLRLKLKGNCLKHRNQLSTLIAMTISVHTSQFPRAPRALSVLVCSDLGVVGTGEPELNSQQLGISVDVREVWSKLSGQIYPITAHYNHNHLLSEGTVLKTSLQFGQFGLRLNLQTVDRRRDSMWKAETQISLHYSHVGWTDKDLIADKRSTSSPHANTESRIWVI